MASLTLREATRADARAIAEIHVAAWRAAYRDLMPQSYLDSLSVEERAPMWEKTIAQPGPARLALAALDGELAGFCLYGPTRDRVAGPEVAEIYAVNVHPTRWRQGAGRLLCAHALREAASREHSAMTLWVMSGNGRARRFYQHLGFEADGTARTNTQLIGSPFDELRYRKAIA
ncbi:MAG TPA: GNAT family N-acetyltransferase [Burkholderiales bacterium]|jgi:ribosomal protein S18 acetylase RimI-like enzyme|nr:GNAT family N-acetyltransferase [Burkholderiales bacterium]